MSSRAELLTNVREKQRRDEFPEAGSLESYIITHLSEEDLIHLFRLTSQGKRDWDFLPREFWENLSTMFYHWDPGVYFGKKYVLFGQITGSGEISQSWRDFAARYVDPEGRLRMEAAVTALAQECLQIEGQPVPDQVELIRFVYEFLFRVFLSEGEDSPMAQLHRYLDEHHSGMVGELKEQADEYLQQPESRQHSLLDLLQTCLANETFRKYYERTR